MTLRLDHFIGGEHSAPADGGYLTSTNPATLETLYEFARGTAADVDRAVDAASQAFSSRIWRRTTPTQRGHLLRRFGDLITENADELARLESQDNGKLLREMVGQLAGLPEYLYYFGGLADKVQGSQIPTNSPEVINFTQREALGVVGLITPWNSPMTLTLSKLAPALAAGNTAVIKPSEYTSRTILRLAELADEAGFPAGVVNVVTGLGAEAGAALAQHPGIAHLGFVGSTQVGSQIAHAAADRVVPTVLELGGKSANLVFADADVDQAIPSLVRSIIQNAGQTCSAGSRLLVHQDIHAEVIEKTAAAMAEVTIGHGLDDPMLGPLISTRQQERVEGFLSDIGAARIVTGGSRPTGLAADLAGGAFIAPTIVDNVAPGSTIAQQEVFGPVVVAMTFADDDEAVALANGTDYGLVSALWTQSLSRAHRLAAEVEAGQVFVNTYGAGGGVELPFGGFKKSGYGREKSMEALDEYTQTKTVVIKL